MKVAIDTSSITDGDKAAHGVRGIGSYTRELVSALKLYAPSIEVVGFSSIAEIPPDAAIVHYPYFDPFYLSLPFVKKKKSIVTVHDFIPLLFPDHFPAGMKGSLKWHVEKFLLGRVDGVISVSDRTKNDCLKLTAVSQDRIRTIYSAGSNMFKRNITQSNLVNLKRKYNLPDRFVLYVGDATWNKNLPRLIRAVKTTGIPLVMAGKALVQDFDSSNPWNRDLVQVKALTEGHSLFLKVGFVSPEDLAGLYRLTLMLVMPSLYEGFGFPILEAMMSKCPVVTTQKGAISEVAGDAAVFVDPENVESIAQGITKLAVSEKEREAFIRKGINQAIKFSWKKTAQETAQFYKEVYDR